MIKIFTLLLLTIITNFTLAKTLTSDSEVMHKIFTGYAYDLSTQELLYTEHHRYLNRYHHQVEYREVNTKDEGISEGNGELFASKHINYQHSFYAPDFEQKNLRNGEKIQSKKKGDNILIRYQENSESRIQEESIRYNKQLVVDAGFDYFITKNWQALITGKTMVIDYLVPSLLDHYELRVKKVVCDPIDKLPENNIQGEHHCFSVAAASFFIRLFSNNLKLTYGHYSKDEESENESTDIRLLRFKGRSNICDSDGNYLDVNIHYQYPVAEG